MADRKPNKDERQRRNRARRDARAARSAHAGEATAIARGEAEAAASKTTSSRVDRNASEGKPAKAGVQDRRAAAKERMKARYPIPGQRAMFLGMVFTAVFIATTLFTEFPIPDTVPENDPRVEDADSVDELHGSVAEAGQAALGDASEPLDVRIYENGRLLDEEDPVPAGLILLAPSAICAGAYWFTKREQRNTVWTMALFALTGYFMFAQPYSLFVLPSLVAVGVGAFQSRKAANEPRMAELRAQREARLAAKAAEAKGADADEDAGDIIDVDPVDED